VTGVGSNRVPDFGIRHSKFCYQLETSALWIVWPMLECLSCGSEIKVTLAAGGGSNRAVSPIWHSVVN